jgi:hypothetical protein
MSSVIEFLASSSRDRVPSKVICKLVKIRCLLPLVTKQKNLNAVN